MICAQQRCDADLGCACLPALLSGHHMIQEHKATFSSCTGNAYCKTLLQFSLRTSQECTCTLSEMHMMHHRSSWCHQMPSHGLTHRPHNLYDVKVHIHMHGHGMHSGIWTAPWVMTGQFCMTGKQHAQPVEQQCQHGLCRTGGSLGGMRVHPCCHLHGTQSWTCGLARPADHHHQ